MAAYPTMLLERQPDAAMNYLLIAAAAHGAPVSPAVDRGRVAKTIEGANLADAAAIKRAVSVPVLCTGGFQTASVIRSAIADGRCDAVSDRAAARRQQRSGAVVRRGASISAPKPCSYCNKCLVNVVEHPLGCYDETRFASRKR